MNSVFYLFMNWLFSLMLLIPVFKLISPKAEPFTFLALFCTSLLYSMTLSLLFQLKDAMVDKSNDWINPENQLPEIGDKIIVKTSVGEPCYAYYSDENEFDVHKPSSDYYRGQWYKYSKRSIIEWKPVT